MQVAEQMMLAEREFSVADGLVTAAQWMEANGFYLAADELAASAVSHLRTGLRLIDHAMEG